jgi:hypothetical protein
MASSVIVGTTSAMTMFDVVVLVAWPLAALKTEQALTEQLGEEWLALLPEMLPYISELMEVGGDGQFRDRGHDVGNDHVRRGRAGCVAQLGDQPLVATAPTPVSQPSRPNRLLRSSLVRSGWHFYRLSSSSSMSSLI